MCVCERERERGFGSVCMRERVCVCVCERERVFGMVIGPIQALVKPITRDDGTQVCVRVCVCERETACV